MCRIEFYNQDFVKKQQHWCRQQLSTKLLYSYHIGPEFHNRCITIPDRMRKYMLGASYLIRLIVSFIPLCECE